MVEMNRGGLKFGVGDRGRTCKDGRDEEKRTKGESSMLGGRVV